jgi:hypothetical protein
MADKTYRTKKDIIIPAGTEVDVEPAGMRRSIGVDFASVVIAVTKDSTAEWTMPLDEAIEEGLVEEVS